MSERLPSVAAVGQDGVMAFQIAGDADADRVLDENPFAVVVGMMLDQQTA